MRDPAWLCDNVGCVLRIVLLGKLAVSMVNRALLPFKSCMEIYDLAILWRNLTTVM